MALKSHRYHELDALRAIAAFGVVCWHYVNAFQAAPFGHILAPFFRRGLLMVDFFFILSGFVLARAFWTSQRSEQLAWNVWSRIARLYPLHFVTLLIVALLQWHLVSTLKSEPFVYHDNSPYNFGLNLLLLQNSGLQSGASFNAPSWSISTEFLVNTIFLALITLPPRAATAGMATLGGIALYGLITHGIVQGGNIFGALDGGMVRTFAGFFLGVGLYKANQYATKVGYRLAFDLVNLVTMVLIGIYLASPSWWSKQGDALCSFVGFPLVIFAAIRTQAFRLLFSKPILVYLGEISYSIYLVHFPLQLLFRVIETSYGVHFAYDSRWMFVIFIITVVSTAAMTYRWIEIPGRQWMMSFLSSRLRRVPGNSMKAR